MEAESRAKKSEAERIETASKLEIANAKTVELERKLAPRILTEAQRKSFLEFISKTPKGKVKFNCVVGNEEAADHCDSLRILFHDAGFILDPNASMFIGTGLRATGVSLGVRNKDHQPPHGGDIQKGLNFVGIQCPAAVEPSESLDNDTVLIYVSAKP